MLHIAKHIMMHEVSAWEEFSQWQQRRETLFEL